MGKRRADGMQTKTCVHSLLIRASRVRGAQCGKSTVRTPTDVLLLTWRVQAEMELALIVATVFRRYEFELRQSTLETREGFLRKPLGLQVGMRRRNWKQ